MDVMGNFKYGDKNDRGERLLEFALEHDMMICNTKFRPGIEPRTSRSGDVDLSPAL